MGEAYRVELGRLRDTTEDGQMVDSGAIGRSVASECSA